MEKISAVVLAVALMCGTAGCALLQQACDNREALAAGLELAISQVEGAAALIDPLHPNAAQARAAAQMALATLKSLLAQACPAEAEVRQAVDAAAGVLQIPELQEAYQRARRMGRVL